MAIFNIDEMINDPWAGLRNTDAYYKYVKEEVKRLFKGGEIEEAPVETFAEYMFGYPPDDSILPAFLFDGREFTYLYNAEFKLIFVRYEEWDSPMVSNTF